MSDVPWMSWWRATRTSTRRDFDRLVRLGPRRRLARAHARSGDRIAIGGPDVLDKAITRFATAYADQNERDHKSLVDAVASGRV